MRKLWMLLIVILATFSLFIVACGGDDDPTDPTDVDWVLMFMQVPDVMARETGYWFEASWNGASSAISASDVFTLSVDGADVPLELHSYNNMWSITASNLMLDTGTSYSVEFKKNGSSIVSKNITTPYPALCDFPESYDPTQSVTLNWSMAGNNQLQSITVSASNWENSSHNYDDKEYKLSSSARSYTIPANAVQDLGVGTDFELGIIQLNNYFSDNVYIYAMQGEGANYNDLFKKVRK